MTSFTGKVAVVTGAGSGIGRALALELARRGARVAASDVDKAGLAETGTQVEAIGGEIHCAPLNVTDRAAVLAYAEEVRAHFGVVHQVYNNAGVAGGGQTLLEADFDTYDRVLGVNLFGVINGTKAFLPFLVASGDGHVINVSSLNGYVGQPTLTAYCASKFGVRGFTEALRTEMLSGGHPVQVTTVHPGGVKTNIASHSAEEAAEAGRELTPAQQRRSKIYNEKLLRMPAATAATIILDGVASGSPRIRVGRDAKMLDILVRLLPNTYPKLTARAERRIFGE